MNIVIVKHMKSWTLKNEISSRPFRKTTILLIKYSSEVILFYYYIHKLGILIKETTCIHYIQIYSVGFVQIYSFR